MVVFYVSHLVGDYLLQTDFQATHKAGGLGRDSIARRALFGHLTTYLMAFVPALIWIGTELGLAATVGIAALIWLPHLIVDDGRFVSLYIRSVKRSSNAVPGLTAAVDQSMHAVSLFAVALLAAA